jgi:uracil-DNA glycosylase
LRLLRPELIVAVGGLAVRRLLGLRSLSECIGSSFERKGAVVIPLPHPSGVSRWLNVPANRRHLDRALALIRAQLQPST